jgi:aldehyde dehydrogenase (NAD+)
MIPSLIPNQINGAETQANDKRSFVKINPHTGQGLWEVTRSGAAEVELAVQAARAALPGWRGMPPVQRGMQLLQIVRSMQDRVSELAEIVAIETGKSPKDARGEVGAAIQCGLFYASEGQRLYGRTTTSGTANKFAMTVRQPVGVAGLIIAANTPIANVAWKVFPALICGNTVVLKAAEDTPATAWLFGCLAREAGLPAGVLNILQGFGPEAGQALVEHPSVGVVSFTGSSRVGQLVHQLVGSRLARVSLELGGKNAFVVCDDANLENAVNWCLLAAFSNAGQRCAAASRIIVFAAIYEEFRHALVAKTKLLRVGPTDGDDFGPVINLRQLENMIAVVRKAVEEGARVLTGGERLLDEGHADGFYMAPTLLEGAGPCSEICQQELFGPIATLHKVADLGAALELANTSPYGLTACIHTRQVHRATLFCDQVQAGVAVVNAGTHGSEPHMPFGGTKLSGNGTREPGTEALDVYSELKNVYWNTDPTDV